MMGNFSSIRKGCGSRKRYANGGKVCKYADGGAVSSMRKGAKTVINIVTPPAAPAGGMPAPMAAGAPTAPPMGNSPSPAAGPVPPAAAAMALGQMQGKPGAPGAFKRGGRVTGGAESGIGRLQASRAQKKVPGKPSATPGRKK